MPKRVRNLALTAHVTCSVGWLGAVVAFLALVVVGSTTRDDQTARAAVLMMEPIAWFALVPLAFASLVTGVISSVGSRWGLFRHYWVIFKLALNLVATAFLVVYTKTIANLADRASDPGTTGADLRTLAAVPVLHTVLALAVLLAATVLAIYKPRGLTRYGWRKQRGPSALRKAPLAQW